MVKLKGELINVGFYSEATAFPVLGVAGNFNPFLLLKTLHSLIDSATVLNPGSLL